MTVEWKDMLLDKVAIGPVSARIYQGADYGKGPPIVLYLHGGAFLDSEKNVDRPVAMSLAKAGAIVVAADYSSLSGNLFPQALEVSFSVFTYLANKRAGLGDRKSLLFVAGEEAGGNVAAGVALKARDQMPDALDGQVLISPLLDPFMGTSSIRKAEAIGMRQRWTEGWSHYLSGGGCHPYAAPCLCSRISGVAPALIFTAEDDPLHDETIGYGARLKQAGVGVRQHVLPAGTGWPSIYGGKSDGAPDWQENVSRHFGSFLRDVSVQPQLH
ncbi:MULTISPECIES: alpha/beta hydrolase fold domain-containing protein [Rhizobium]|uniref:Alpha/beta hydrolase n=1 Tax=Rhizobium anhuiense TaxID=1184720 RepID=A0A432NDS7_9HYPH|nr:MULTISPECIES: alpha/beta hydrolase [Rhizobium]KZS54330.1 esterase [Rhizobium anhuiense bv. trifolii]MBB3296389.1 acetyl esterase/lipase [Rhizobium sp. BK112]MBB3365604.1 acetyl esterase/lipase [Rhizobium sp. BK077]MBB4176282.1 acetyl esterase/lipase [Rhizobium sp. BK109]MBB4214790.1 acetyl esterase/lipase [Rhizobium sp. BK212]